MLLLTCAPPTQWCSQFQDNSNSGSGVPRPPISLRLIVPASQCGSLIGKGGSKIKEIREVTGASIQVASEMLPNSTERAVTLSGTGEAITQCIFHICNVMLEVSGLITIIISWCALIVFLFQSPPKGATIPYRPKPQVGGPVILAGGQAYTIQGNYAVPAHADVSTPLISPLLTPHHAHPHHPFGPALAAVAPQAPTTTLFEFKNGPLPAHGALPPQHLLPDVSWSYWWHQAPHPPKPLRDYRSSSVMWPYSFPTLHFWFSVSVIPLAMILQWLLWT